MSKTSRIVDYLIVGLLILSGGSIPNIFFRNQLTILLFVLLAGAFLLNIRQLKRREFRFLIVSILGVLIALLVNYYFAIGYQKVVKFGFIFLCFLISFLAVIRFKIHLSSRRFLEVFRSVLYVVLVHALFNFIAYPFVKGSLTLIEYDFNGFDCSTFKNIFFFEQSKNEINFFGLTLCRNQGFFGEPGILQIYLNILLFIELFINSIKKKWHISLISVGLLTTYSTTGIALLLLQLSVYFYRQIRRNIILLPLLVVIMAPIYQVMKSNVEDKVFGDRSSSFTVRMFDLVQPLLIVKEHPVTGVGLDKETYRITRSKYSYSSEYFKFDSLEKGSSNSILFMLSSAGIPVTMVLIMGLYRQNLFRHREKLFFVIMIVSLMSEPLLLTPFFLFFIILGMYNQFQYLSWGKTF